MVRKILLLRRLTVEEIGTAQTEILNTLEANRDKLKAALGELSGQESMVCSATDSQ